MAKGGDAPNRVIFGQATKLSRTMHDIRYSAKRDEIYVTNPFAQAILAFRGTAKGEEAPIRVIQGPKTQLSSEDTLEIDDVNGEILIPSGEQILAYPIDGNGDIAPLRVVKPLNKAWRTGGGIIVDPIHNVLVTDGTLVGEKTTAEGRAAGGEEGGNRRDSILIFERLANGETKPLRVIRGPRTGIKAIRQMAMYPEKGHIVIAQITDGGIPEPEGTYVGVWSINDSGDVPPRWKIDGKPSNIMKKPRGVTLNPKNKELIVSDMRMNAVLTFYFPEMF